MSRFKQKLFTDSALKFYS